MRRICLLAPVLFLCSCAALGLPSPTTSQVQHGLQVAGDAAIATGTPWGEILGGTALVAAAVLGNLHLKNAKKIAKVAKPAV